MAVAAALTGALAAGLLLPERRRVLPVSGPTRVPGPPSSQAVSGGARVAWAASAGLAGWVWLPGPLGALVAVGLAGAAWVVIGRHEPAAVRRERALARAQLPTLVTLFAACLRTGGSPAAALDLVCSAYPGPAADRLGQVSARLRVGVDPVTVWSDLGVDPVLAPLGRCLARAHESGAAVADAVAGLARELADERRSGAEDRARAVGVRAALPLGLCLLPAFVLIGIVPVVVGLLSSVIDP